MRRRLVPSRVEAARRGTFSELLLRSEWALGFLCMVFDAISWVGAYELLTHCHQWIAGFGGGLQSSVCLVQFTMIVVCLFIVGGYDRRTNFLSLNYMSEHFITLLAAGCLGGLTIYAGSAYGQLMHPSRGILLASQLAFAPLSLIYRRYLWQMLQARVKRGYFLVLGAGELARHLHRSNLLSSNRQCLRFVDPIQSDRTGLPQAFDLESTDAPTIEVLPYEQFASLLERTSGVIIAEDTRQMSKELLEGLSRLHYQGVSVYTLETFYARYWRRVPVHAIDATWPIQVEAQLADASVYAHAKRLIDIVAASAALLALMPLFALVALLVRLESGSPVIFRQTRVGCDEHPFWIYKFRTMYTRPVEDEGSLYTRAKDPRITPLGGWLRKLRLDELPQLWNVLKGDMSLIGPRAEWDRLVAQYEQSIPFYHFRHLVKPGITGWAQVNYPYGASREDTVQKLKYDLYYIRHYSLRLDAMIVLKTLHTMVWGKGQ